MERGILFSAPMVRAILAGTKTQTRRAVKFPPGQSLNGLSGPIEYGGHSPGTLRCPYGAPGDRLWVREAWQGVHGGGVVFRADCDAEDRHPKYGQLKWKPGIHLRRADARITLDVLSVRVERLHDISEEDARSEGVTVRDNCGCPCACHGPAENPGPHLPECLWHATDLDPWEEPAKASFAALWRSINGADSWDANPWAWRIEFSRVTP